MHKSYLFKRCLLILFILGFTLTLFAKNVGLPEVHYYKRNDYGASSKNWQIAQGETGILYFANEDGLLSFDGTYWDLTPSEMGLRSVKIINDRIYVGSFNDFGYYIHNDANRLEYTSLMKSPDLDLIGNIWNIEEYDGRIFFQGEKAIAIIFNDKLEKVIRPIGRFQQMKVTNDRLFVVDRERGLCEYIQGVIYPIKGGDILKNKLMVSLATLESQSLVIGTQQDGLFTISGNVIEPWNTELSPLLKEVNIYSLAQYSEDLLIIGTIQMGLLITTTRGKLVTHIGKDMGLTNNTVLTTFVDRERNIWCGLDKGIAKIKYRSNITFLDSYFDIGTGYDIVKNGNEFYFATNQAIYSIEQTRLSNPLKNRTDFAKISGTEGQCWSLYKDEDGVLAGHDKGVLSILKRSSEKITPNDVNGVWCFRPIPGNTNLIMAGTYNGLILLEKINKKWTFKRKIIGFDQLSRQIEWQNSQTLIVGQNKKGVLRLSLSDDYSSIDKVDTIPISNFPKNKGELAMFIYKGDLLFSSKWGIYSLGKDGKTPEQFNDFDSFFEKLNYPLRFKPDEFGNVWYFYNNKIGVLRKLEDETYRNFTEPFLPIGDQLVPVFQNVFAIDNSTTFFNIENGFADYNQSESRFSNATINPICVHVSSLRSLDDTTSYSLFQKNGNSIPQEVIPEFKYQQNTIIINYSASVYNTESIEFSTFLEGYDKKPLPWSIDRSRRFSNLREGKYIFKIKARSGTQSESTLLSYVFEIQPPWYRSFIAKLIYLILILTFLYFMIKLVIKYISKVEKNASNHQHENFRLKEQQFSHESIVIEKELIRLRNEKLIDEMHHKENELASLAIHVVRKRDFLSELKEQLVRITRLKEPAEFGRKVGNLIKKIDQDIANESNWEAFERTFELVHASFLEQLKNKHPNLNQREQKICAYIRMRMTSNEIASLLNISTRAVENNRYKLRQNLGLQQTDNLAEYICNL